MINSSEPNEEEEENINLKIRSYGAYNSILYDSLDERLFRSKSFMFPLIPAPASDSSSVYINCSMISNLFAMITLRQDIFGEIKSTLIIKE